MPNPTRAELLAAADRIVEDVITPDLRVLFCGINPGLYTAWCGHHFARPGNRFWPALHLGGFTPRLLQPAEERELLALGLGITNLAARPKSGKVQLTWTAYPGASSYNIYRGTISGGPYLKIGSTASTYSTYLDGNVVNGTTYYYVVRAAAANTNELCQSNQSSAKPATR